MTAEAARGKAIELQHLLNVIVKAEGSGETLTCPLDALERMDDVVGLLTPSPDAEDDGAPLRVVADSEAQP